MSAVEIGIRQVGLLEMGFFEVDLREMGALKLGPLQVTVLEPDPFEVGPPEMGAFEIGIPQEGTGDLDPVKRSAAEVGLPGAHQPRRERPEEKPNRQSKGQTVARSPIPHHALPAIDLRGVPAKQRSGEAKGIPACPDGHDEQEQVQANQPPIRCGLEPFKAGEILPPEETERQRHRSPGSAERQPHHQPGQEGSVRA